MCVSTRAQRSYVYTCVCVCKCACMCLSVLACLYVCVCAHACVCVSVYPHICACLCECISVCVSVCLSVCQCVCACVCKCNSAMYLFLLSGRFVITLLTVLFSSVTSPSDHLSIFLVFWRQKCKRVLFFWVMNKILLFHAVQIGIDGFRLRGKEKWGVCKCVSCEQKCKWVSLYM